MIPACSHVGTPRHFQSSTTSGTAWVMVLRTFANTSPRQSPRSMIRSSMSDDGARDSLAFAAGDFSPDAFFGAGFRAAGFLAAVDFLAGGMPLLSGGQRAQDQRVRCHGARIAPRASRRYAPPPAGIRTTVRPTVVRSAIAVIASG